jgi:phosphonate degradation associated HDIG domain protein
VAGDGSAVIAGTAQVKIRETTFSFTRSLICSKIALGSEPCPNQVKIMPSTNSASVVDFIFDLFARQGATEYMGEAVTMSQHMEQTAACAVTDDAADELVIAALLHDIGHFIGEHPIDALEKGIDNNHEDVGANYLQTHFPATISEPVRLHVAAKRYLCATDPTYLDRLSDASVNSLNVQGGPMSASEIESFEANPHHQSAVKLRLYDDDGKVAGLTINPVTTYRETIESLVSQ